MYEKRHLSVSARLNLREERKLVGEEAKKKKGHARLHKQKRKRTATPYSLATISLLPIIHVFESLLDSERFPGNDAGIQSTNGAFTLSRQESHDGDQDCADPPSRLPVLWMVSCDAQTHFLVQLEPSIRLYVCVYSNTRKRKYFHELIVHLFLTLETYTHPYRIC